MTRIEEVSLLKLEKIPPDVFFFFLARKAHCCSLATVSAGGFGLGHVVRCIVFHVVIDTHLPR